MRRADPHRALIRALLTRHPELVVEEARTEPWASVTFTGMRHVLRCAPIDLEGLDEAEFALPDHVLADITAGCQGGSLVIEALTIETS
jgi:hypothetical protein